MITMSYVKQRYIDFVNKYSSVLNSLNYEQAVIQEKIAALQARLDGFDFKRYGDNPVHFLHAGKRITRNSIRVAIQHSPAQKQWMETLRQQYHSKIAAAQKENPNMGFFSFESAHARDLKIDFSKHRQQFCV